MEPLDATPADLEYEDGAEDEETSAWRSLSVGCVSGVIGVVLLLIVAALGLWYSFAKAEVNPDRPLPLLAGPDHLNNTAWMVVRLPGQTPQVYAAALRQANAAVEAAPDNGYFINTLGVAQYRMEQYPEAFATLTKSDKLNATKNGSIPADLAFLAMVKYKLGQKEEAKEDLERLRKYLRDPRRIRDRESHAFLVEAEELIETGAAEKK
jgi:tetratricopeptide (TPR) repeat protein